MIPLDSPLVLFFCQKNKTFALCAASSLNKYNCAPCCENDTVDKV